MGNESKSRGGKVRGGRDAVRGGEELKLDKGREREEGRLIKLDF